MLRILLLLLLVVSSSLIEAAENALYRTLVTDGLTVAGELRSLPLPTLADGLDREAQWAAIETITDENHPREALLRQEVGAPLVLKIKNDPAGSTVRRIDVWFVAYGALKTVQSEAFWKKEKKEDTPTRWEGKQLTADDLRRRGISSGSESPSDEQYAAGSLTLFDRVDLQVTVHAMRSTTVRSVVAATIVDSRFRNDAEFPNRWQRLLSDGTVANTPDAFTPYDGMGGYVKVTPLVEPAGALFVEAHLMFDEPLGWFRGTNLLRSKLPLATQIEVRKFRRRLAQLEGR